MPGTDEITVYQGEDVTLGFTMSPVVDVSGWTLLLTVEDDVDPTTKVLSAAGVVTNGPNGKFTVTLDDTATGTDQTPGHYTYDVWRTDADGERLLAIGSFLVKDSARFPEGA